MGLFNFFKRTKTAEITETVKTTKESNTSTKKDQPQNNFLTNIEDFGFDELQLGISGKIRVDGILAIAELQKRAKAKDISFSYSVLYISLLEEGALTVPIVIKFGEKAYSLYFIYNEEDLLKYKDLQKHVVETKYPNLIYFSSIPIYDGYDPKEIIEPFQLADLRHEKDPKIGGTYAMWWTDKELEKFEKSKTLGLLTKLYDVYKGYETHLLGYLIRQTGITEEKELKRMNLPEVSENFVVVGPENKMILLDVSQEKGIRFLFPITGTSKEYRERFLEGVLVDFLSTRIYLEKNKIEKDVTTEPNSYDWFTFMSKATISQEEKGESIQLVGGLELN